MNRLSLSLIAVLLVGCAPPVTSPVTTTASNPTFDAINGTFAGVKTATSAVASTTLPAAAIATTLASIELVKALSLDTNALADVGGNVQPNHPPANIVSAGGGNAVPQVGGFALMQAGGAKELKIDQTNVKATVIYTVTIGADKSVKAVIDSFKGKTNGYDLDAKGTYGYTPGTAAGVKGAVSCDMVGKVTYKELVLALETFKLATEDPLPKSATIGEFKITGLDGTRTVGMGATLSTNDQGKILVKGNLAVDGQSKPIAFDQDKPTISDADVPAAKP